MVFYSKKKVVLPGNELNAVWKSIASGQAEKIAKRFLNPYIEKENR